jgi:hypothetical protein
MDVNPYKAPVEQSDHRLNSWSAEKVFWWTVWVLVVTAILGTLLTLATPVSG